MGMLLAGRAASMTLLSSPSSLSSEFCLAYGGDPQGEEGHWAPNSPGTGKMRLLPFLKGCPLSRLSQSCRSMWFLNLQQLVWVEMESGRSFLLLEHRQGEFSFL